MIRLKEEALFRFLFSGATNLSSSQGRGHPQRRNPRLMETTSAASGVLRKRKAEDTEVSQYKRDDVREDEGEFTLLLFTTIPNCNG